MKNMQHDPAYITANLASQQMDEVESALDALREAAARLDTAVRNADMALDLIEHDQPVKHTYDGRAKAVAWSEVKGAAKDALAKHTSLYRSINDSRSDLLPFTKKASIALSDVQQVRILRAYEASKA